jgi:uncharacterized protein (DUF849 family)
VIQACLNGARTSGVPVMPEQLAADVAATLTAVRQAAPGVEISLSTGLWITGGDPGRRYELVAAWDAKPELVSLNLSEDDWQRLAALLAERGIGIEAGLATIADAEALARSELDPVRVLVEVEGGVDEAQAIDAVLDRAGHAGHGCTTARSGNAELVRYCLNRS